MLLPLEFWEQSDNAGELLLGAIVDDLNLREGVDLYVCSKMKNKIL